MIWILADQVTAKLRAAKVKFELRKNLDILARRLRFLRLAWLQILAAILLYVMSAQNAPIYNVLI